MSNPPPSVSNGMRGPWSNDKGKQQMSTPPPSMVIRLRPCMILSTPPSAPNLTTYFPCFPSRCCCCCCSRFSVPFPPVLLCVDFSMFTFFQFCVSVDPSALKKRVQITLKTT
ncbi:unnamed protein product [Laminaria digitata]